MKRSRYAVFCSDGLGDGLIFLLIANNLRQNNQEVTLYHKNLSELKEFLNGQVVLNYPKESKIREEIENFDYIIVNTDSTKKNKLVQKIALEIRPNTTYLIHGTTCKAKNLPGNIFLRKEISLVENLMNFCREKLKLSKIIKSNGIKSQVDEISQKQNVILFHITSADSDKNWQIKKFLKLAKKLKKDGYENISFVFKKGEETKYNFLYHLGYNVVFCSDLYELATLISKSKYMIGNDSGIGHLASSMQIPTCIIYNTPRKKFLWKTDFFKTKSIAPYSFLPNFKCFRIRDKYWRNFISITRVYKNFKKLCRGL